MKTLVANLRQTILQLAVEGKLIPQDPSDQPASKLLKQINFEKQKLLNENKTRKSKPLPPITEGEQTFTIPRSWEFARLGEISNYAHLNKIEPNKILNNTWLLEMEDIEPKTSRLKHKIYSGSRTPKSTKNIFEAGYIIYGKLRPYLNKIIITDEAGVCSTEMIPIRAYRISQKYLFYYLKSPGFISRANKLSTGINLPRLATVDAVMQLIPIPPLAEQKRIVVKVEELMKLCDELEEKSDGYLVILSRLRQTILQLAIEGKLASQNPLDESADKLLKQSKSEKHKLIEEKRIRQNEGLPVITESEKPFELPHTWEWIRLSDLTEINLGKTPSRSEDSNWSNGACNWVTISDMQSFGTITCTKERISKNACLNTFNTAPPTEGTLLLSFKLTIGKTSILGIPAFHNEAIASLPFYIERKTLTSFYLWILATINLDQHKTNAVKGATLNKSKLQRLVVPLPPLEEQKRIVCQISKYMKLCGELEAKLHT